MLGRCCIMGLRGSRVSWAHSASHSIQHCCVFRFRHWDKVLPRLATQESDLGEAGGDREDGA